MPNTCTQQQTTTNQTLSTPSQNIYPNIILHLFDKTCTLILYNLLQKGLRSILQQHFQNKPTAQLQSIINYSQSATHTSLLTLFFLILNIDSTLKQAIWDMECKKNLPKLERFLMDLKTKLVTDFCMNESMTPNMFVNNCWEYYVLS